MWMYVLWPTQWGRRWACPAQKWWESHSFPSIIHTDYVYFPTPTSSTLSRAGAPVAPTMLAMREIYGRRIGDHCERINGMRCTACKDKHKPCHITYSSSVKTLITARPSIQTSRPRSRLSAKSFCIHVYENRNRIIGPKLSPDTLQRLPFSGYGRLLGELIQHSLRTRSSSSGRYTLLKDTLQQHLWWSSILQRDTIARRSTEHRRNIRPSANSVSAGWESTPA